MIFFDILKIYNIAIGIFFLVCYSYQVFFLISGTFIKPPKYKRAEKQRRYAFCIAARNEEAVISQLCDSIRAQDYPAELIDIFIVADNCNDKTAEVGRACGAHVYERFNDELIGKGYALTFLFNEIEKSVGIEAYDGYFVVDADNLLDKKYVSAMNDCADAGHKVAMCYRNSKNYAQNWITAGYSLWFLRASRHLNNPRHYFGTSCEITGTGFYASSEIIKENGGWCQHCLIEDIEFTIDCVLRGEKVAFCYDAIVYDEQPAGFMQSLRQRKRWCKGYIQIMKKYGFKLFSAFFRGKGFSNFDMIMAISPAFFISTITVVLNIILASLVLIFDISLIVPLLWLEFFSVLSAYLLFVIVGGLAAICERKRIKAPTYKVVLYLFSFPVFVATFIVTTFMAIFSKVVWKPIEHHAADTSKFEDSEGD